MNTISLKSFKKLIKIFYQKFFPNFLRIKIKSFISPQYKLKTHVGESVDIYFQACKKELELKKQKAELEGNKGQYEANISKVSQAISETELEIANIKTEKLNEILKELQEVQTKIADLEERTSASSDVLTRTLITAPVSGIINNLKYHTKGGVISPGAEILEIIPQDEELIVEVSINPADPSSSMLGKSDSFCMLK